MSTKPGRLRSLFSRSPHPAPSSVPAELASIDGWVCPFTGDPPRAASVHVVVGGKNWRQAAWMLASWLHFTESAWKIVIHDDGTLTDEAESALRKIFAAARIIRRKESDAALQPVLGAFPFAETLRADDPNSLRILDARHFSDAEKFFVFSTGVLFFNHPREMIDWAESDAEECWLTEAAEEKSIVKPAEARDELGVEVWPRADDGIWMISKPAFDLEFIDAALARTSLLRGSLEHTTRTLAMLCAARNAKGGLLPRRFEVSRQRQAADDAVCRHYDGAARERFVTDGLRRVAPHLFPPDEAS
ncbi:MAG TPA: hypothetical protein VEO95_12230 [Chthoniobacteraceae bacterium]|nr:hypothetical protein [Chthoniobacteraceae bacterium]